MFTTDHRAARSISRRTLLGMLGAGAVGLLTACGGGGASQPAPAGGAAPAPAASPAGAAPAPASSPAAAAPPAAAPAASPPSVPAVVSPAAAAPAGATSPSGLPSYYPANYGEIVEASKKEGKLNVYSIMSKPNWAPVLDEFKKRYSWIDVDAPDLDAATIFDRYYTETAGNVRSADLIITSSPDAWQEFIKKGEVLDYKSPEDDKVPAWSKLAPGVYTVSSDPMVIIWNKKLVNNPPKAMAELGDLVTKEAGRYTPGKVVTYEENNATGFAGNWFWAKKVGQDKAFQILEAIGKTKPKLESSGGRMVDATLAGETPLGYFVSLITVLPKFPAANDVLGWSMIGDGTPLIIRGMAITKKAQASNSARLLVDFTLSAAGQIAWAEGGLTSYRPDVADQAKISLSKFTAQVGEQNLAPFSLDPDLADETKREAFRARLKTALGR